MLAEHGRRKVVMRAHRRRHDPRQLADFRPAGVRDAIGPRRWRGDAVGKLAQRNARHLGIRHVAVIEARLQRSVTHALQGHAGDLVLEIDLEQRIAFERGRHELAEADECRVGKRADARLARDAAL